MISIKLAKEISLLKWEGELSEMNNNYSQINLLYPKANDYFYCGFCIRHNYKLFPEDRNKCLNCEIASSPAKCCLEKDSLYNKLDDPFINSEETNLLIKELIEIIKNIPEEDE